jgi:SAM-dependent methyltransferase
MVDETLFKEADDDKLRVDFGCGKNKRKGFIGVDVIDFEGVDVVLDIGTDRWPWEDGSVEEAHASHFVEHLLPEERIHFVNELYRVLKKGGKATIITPHWASCRAYGDLSHQWPPVSEFWFYYLKIEWREVNAPHNQAYTCDFDSSWGYGMSGDLANRNDEYKQFALANYKEAAADLYATLTKR